MGAATLSGLPGVCRAEPVAVLVDDAQWLDVSSAQALLFAFRRPVADPIAVFVAVREGEPSLLDGADLPTLQIKGLTSDEAAQLMPGLTAETAALLHRPRQAIRWRCWNSPQTRTTWRSLPRVRPSWCPPKISQAFLHRAGLLSQAAQQALVLAAASDTTDLATLQRAAAGLGIDLAALADAESAGLAGQRRSRARGIRHPLARLAIYTDAPADQRRGCAPGTGHRAAGPGRGPPRLASGRRGGGHGRVGVGGAGAGWRPGRGPQCVRGRGRGLRAGRAADRRRRAAGAAAAGGGRGGVAGRAGRPRRDAARRGPRHGTQHP